MAEDGDFSDAIVGGAAEEPTPYTDLSGPTYSSGTKSVIGFIVIAVLIILLIALVYYAYVNSQGLGAALTRAGWTMWTQNGCPACVAQAGIIGPGSFKYVKKKSCLPGSNCPVDAFPTWVNSKTGESRTGVQGPLDLNAMAKKQSARRRR